MFFYVKDVKDVSPLDKKFEAFNWNVIVIDGHTLVLAGILVVEGAAGSALNHIGDAGLVAGIESDLASLPRTMHLRWASLGR